MYVIEDRNGKEIVEYVRSWKSRRLFKTEVYPLHNTFLPNIEQFGCKTGIQFNITLLVIERYNYATTVVSSYINYDLDNQQEIHLIILY